MMSTQNICFFCGEIRIIDPSNENHNVCFHKKIITWISNVICSYEHVFFFFVL